MTVHRTAHNITTERLGDEMTRIAFAMDYFSDDPEDWWFSHDNKWTMFVDRRTGTVYSLGADERLTAWRWVTEEQADLLAIDPASWITEYLQANVKKEN